MFLDQKRKLKLVAHLLLHSDRESRKQNFSEIKKDADLDGTGRMGC